MRETSVWTMAVVFLFVALLLPATNIAFEGATETKTQVNESVTVDYDAASTLDPGEDVLSFEPGPTVYNASDAELVNGTDYEYRPTNGTIAWFNTTNTTAGESAAATYDYTVREQTAKDGSVVANIIGELAPLLVLIAAVGAVFRYGTGW